MTKYPPGVSRAEEREGGFWERTELVKGNVSKEKVWRHTERCHVSKPGLFKTRGGKGPKSSIEDLNYFFTSV